MAGAPLILVVEDDTDTRELILEVLRADGALAEVPVLVLSADRARRLAAQRGVVAVVGKPLEFGRLLRLVRAVTRRR
jgi:CheY-like chemotaxis protein